jgi:hypothetical protein
MEQLSGRETGAQAVQCKDDKIDSNEENVDGAVIDLEGGNATGETSLRLKLRELQVLRAQMVADIDEDIMSLQKALYIIGATSQ